jgi:GntR family transcriptional regulator, transcriptional repressor for pyruvate dehydrogenase complex
MFLTRTDSARRALGETRKRNALAQRRKPKSGTQLEKRQLVQTTAARLRDLVLAAAPDSQIGSLTEIAERLGVGIVTVQQAARILEHEGLLAVRRGPGGGYYGTRPDEAALERSVAAYMRVHGSSLRESLAITTLLDCEMVPAAARCTDETLRAALQSLCEQIGLCDTEEERIAFEDEFHKLLFKMDPRPLFELLARVATQFYKSCHLPPLFRGREGVAAWKAGRRQIVEAILRRDEALARFEAERHRRDVLSRMENIEWTSLKIRTESRDNA